MENQNQPGDVAESGILPMITTYGNSKHHIDINTNHKANGSNDVVCFPFSVCKQEAAEGSTTEDETYSASGYSSSEHSRDDENDERFDSDSDSDEADAQSTQSNTSMDSAQLLLKQAQARLHHQSIYEEVQHLRTLVSGHETHAQVLTKQKSSLLNKCNALEESLANIVDQLTKYKHREQQLKETQAEREKEYMNQLNEVCRVNDAKEQDYMGQLIERDMRIVELQNALNEREEEMRRLKLRMEGREVGDVVSKMETDMMMIMGLEEQGEQEGVESDDSSCDYI
jgi:chromosome segregation ATPase|mmetsp:Transcript_612/g.1417  ORF Transcript_612/g.1417 Transcript_612/m.1417 type:complete len:284 (-) Transcript_612:3-854(-)